MSALTMVLGLLAIPALVALNAFFVAAEFALVAVRRSRIEEMLARNVSGAKAVLSAIDHLDRSIAATQVGITLSSIGLGMVAEKSLSNALEGAFSALPEPFNVLGRHAVAGTMSFMLVTFLHVVFGELFPKSLALLSPARVSLWVAPPLRIFELSARPIIWIMNGTGNFLVRLCGLKSHHESMVHSVEELALLIEDTEEAGILDSDQAIMVQNVFGLSAKQVSDCMVPREKMAAVEIKTPLARVLELIRTEGHTRMPVFDGDIDNIVGIVNAKDLFFMVGMSDFVVLEDALYPALYLKPDEDIANAMRLFRKAKRHMALVRDEEGKIQGLVTLEDILEEIIGDIEDEQDKPFAQRRFLKIGKSRPWRKA
ncbi:MAG: hemolysin family protein [Gemmataceae bacterium]|nr:hemolysin family protein [Gemmataceae bacterium]